MHSSGPSPVLRCEDGQAREVGEGITTVVAQPAPDVSDRKAVMSTDGSRDSSSMSYQSETRENRVAILASSTLEVAKTEMPPDDAPVSSPSSSCYYWTSETPDALRKSPLTSSSQPKPQNALHGLNSYRCGDGGVSRPASFFAAQTGTPAASHRTSQPHTFGHRFAQWEGHRRTEMNAGLATVPPSADTPAAGRRGSRTDEATSSGAAASLHLRQPSARPKVGHEPPSTKVAAELSSHGEHLAPALQQDHHPQQMVALPPLPPPLSPKCLGVATSKLKWRSRSCPQTSRGAITVDSPQTCSPSAAVSAGTPSVRRGSGVVAHAVPLRGSRGVDDGICDPPNSNTAPLRQRSAAAAAAIPPMKEPSAEVRTGLSCVTNVESGGLRGPPPSSAKLTPGSQNDTSHNRDLTAEPATPLTPVIDVNDMTTAAGRAAASVMDPFLEEPLDRGIGALLTHEMEEGIVIVDSRSPPDDLICHVCMSVCYQPTATLCGHLFCRRCLQVWMQMSVTSPPLCPTDRSPIQVELLHTDSRAQRQINGLRCRCPGSLSYELQLELLGLATAGTACEGRTVGKGDEEEKASNLAIDVSVGAATPGTPAEKAEPRCKWVGCVSDAAAHLHQCPHVVIMCSFAPQGCNVKLPRGKMAAHFMQCTAEHLLLVSRALEDSTRQHRVLQEEVEVLWQRCALNGASRRIEGATVSGIGQPLRVARPTTMAERMLASPAAAVNAALGMEDASQGGLSPLQATRSSRYGASRPAEYAAPFSTPPHLSQLNPSQHPSLAATVSPPHLRAERVQHLVLRSSGEYGGISPQPTGAMLTRTASSQYSAASSTTSPTPLPATTTWRLPPSVAPPPPPPPPPAYPLLGSTGMRCRCRTRCEEGEWEEMMGDRHLWIVPAFTSLKAPCYSRPFVSHGLQWYLGINTSATWEPCGVFLFASGHEHRIDFRIALYNADPSRDVLHEVQDWKEEFIGKGWGPLRFINRFTLEQDGFLVRGCLRVGVEVLGEPY